jgi:hypothetical protein
MVFEALIQQVVQQSFASSATDLIIAVTGLAGAIGGILIAVSGYMKAGKAKDFALQAGQVGQMANQKATEAKDRIATGIDAFYQLAPEEQKKVLDATIPDMNKLKQEVKAGTAQVDRIDSIIPEFKAKNLDVPREKFATKPSDIDR